MFKRYRLIEALTKTLTQNFQVRDLDLKVTQGGSLWYCVKLQTNIYQHAKYQLDPSTWSRDIDLQKL